ncbi:MAG: hypothetical protein Q8P90_03950 [bacterium]|nr:hypothetical protein [bacterium]
MDISKLYTKNACSLEGGGSDKWTWQEYYKKKAELSEQGIEVVLIDMINQPVAGSIPISNELFEKKYPDGTYFVLYCHSGGTSGHLQKQLKPKLTQYHFINMTGGVGAYQPEKN